MLRASASVGVGALLVLVAGIYFARRRAASSAEATALELAPLDLGDVLEGITVTVSELNFADESSSSAWQIPASGQRFAKLLGDAEGRYGLPRNLLARMAWQECRFRDDIITGKVRSGAGAVGMMQIIPKWHPELAPGDAAADEKAALDPERAIDYAGMFMRRLFNRFRSWPLAVAAYNAGEGNVAKYGNTVPPFAETQAYVRDVSRDVGLA